MNPSNGREPKVNVNRILLVVGLLVAVTAAGLLVREVIDSGLAVTFGILGIGLIAVSGRAKRARS
jgi:high-affinity Fe2+/Pb2+ permease